MKHLMKTKKDNPSIREVNRRLIAKDLHKVMIDWRKSLNIYDSKTPIPKKLNKILEDHFSDILSIIRQYVVNESSSTKKSKKSGGQRNDLGREFFKYEIALHQIKNSKNPFPSWKKFDRELEKHNLERNQEGLPDIKMSSRSYDIYKEEWQSGEFDFPEK